MNPPKPKYDGHETEREMAIAYAIAEGWTGTVEEYMTAGLHQHGRPRSVRDPHRPKPAAWGQGPHLINPNHPSQKRND